MATVNPPTMTAVVSPGLKITMIACSAFGLAVWGTSIGFLYGWSYTMRYLAGIDISILVNVAMIYTASRLIFLVTRTNFPNAAGVEDLHQCVARMVAVTVVGLAIWAISVRLLALHISDSLHDICIVYHGCNYGFVFSAVVAGLAGGILSQVTVRTPAYTGPVHAVNPVARQPSQVHYNQAYMHHYEAERL